MNFLRLFAVLFLACIAESKDSASYKTASWTNVVTTTINDGAYTFVPVNNGTSIVNNITYVFTPSMTAVITNCPCTLTQASIYTTTYSYNIYSSQSWSTYNASDYNYTTALQESGGSSGTSSGSGSATSSVSTFVQDTDSLSTTSTGGAGAQNSSANQLLAFGVWVLSLLAVF